MSLVLAGAGAGPDEAAALASFRAEVRAWVLERLAPQAETWEAQRRFPRATLREMGRRGYLGLTISPEAGGQGRSLWYRWCWPRS